MRLLDLTLPDPADNLALDEALLLAAEDGPGGEVLRLWENPTYAVVLGSGGSVSVDVDEAACAADGVPVLRRASGGGTVVLGPGCLCFAAVLRYDRAPGLDSVAGSARYVLGWVTRAVRPVVPDAAVCGVSDLAAGGRKFSGSAQQRKRAHFLHHGTLLCGFDLDRIGRYLRPPERQPDYRQSRPHAEFVANLPLDVGEARRLLLAEVRPEGDYDPVPWDRVRELADAKYRDPEWTRRR